MRKKPTVPHRFSAMTFNLRFGLAEDEGENRWERRKKALPELFNEYCPDFIGLQECNDFQIDFLADILPDYGYIGKLDPAPRNWQNNVIFYNSHWKPGVRRHLFLSETPTVPSKFQGSRWPRQCTIGMFTKGHRQLICVNTHFDFTEDVQTRSAILIMEQLARMPSDVPSLLTGDFNATPEHKCHSVFTGGHGGLPLEGPFFKNAAPRPRRGTYHGFEGHSDGEHIDWILYRGRIRPLEYEVITDRFEGLYPSDHFPVYAEFGWVRDDG